jgi:hypothetical protein
MGTLTDMNQQYESSKIRKMEQIQTEIVENSTDGLDLFRNYIIINI